MFKARAEVASFEARVFEPKNFLSDFAVEELMQGLAGVLVHPTDLRDLQRENIYLSCVKFPVSNANSSTREVLQSIL